MKARAIVNPSRTAKTAVLLLGCVFGLNTLAANNILSECDEMSQVPQNLVVPVRPLDIRMTDLILAPPADDALESLSGLAAIDARAITPVLSLTPRVSDLLDQVFAVDADTSDLTETEPGESASPLADFDAPQNDSVLSSDEELEPPQIQQRMYRKDI